MRGLVWIVALAACAKQGGVQISVSKGATAATTVRIFVGAGAPTTDTTITAIGGVVHTGTSWFRDPTVGDDTATLSGDRVNWFYEPSGAPTRLPIVIAVGFDASGAVVGAGTLEAVDVPDSGFLSYDLPLVAPTNLSVWDSDATASPLVDKCVALGPKGNEQMIVSPDDEDCDGFVDGSVKECAPLVYRAASRTALPDEFSCLVPGMLGAPTTQCFAGGPTCTDGTGPSDSSCTPSHYCTAGPACVCTTFDCLGTMGTQIPHYECTVALEADGNGAKLCTNKLTLASGTGSDCTNARLRNAQQNFQPTLAVDSTQRSLRFTAELDKCQVSIKPEGSFQTTQDPTVGNDVLAVMAIDSVATPFSGFVIPIVFRFGPVSAGCGSGPVVCRQIAGIGATDRTSLCTEFAGLQ